MSTSFLGALVQGAPAYRVRTSWPPVRAVLAAFALFVLAMVAGWAVVELIGSAVGLSGNGIIAGLGEDGQQSGAVPVNQLLWLAVVQLVLIGLVLYAARVFGDRTGDVLALGPPAQGRSVYGAALVMLFVCVGSFTYAAWLISPDTLTADIKPFVETMRAGHGWILLPIAVLGAPASEELLFRGFLFPALANTAMGARGSAIITSGAWALMHGTYSYIGLIQVFIVGLLLTWFLWRTGSLWVPLVCHSAYNFFVIAMLAVLPLSV